MVEFVPFPIIYSFPTQYTFSFAAVNRAGAAGNLRCHGVIAGIIFGQQFFHFHTDPGYIRWQNSSMSCLSWSMSTRLLLPND